MSTKLPFSHRHVIEPPSERTEIYPATPFIQARLRVLHAFTRAHLSQERDRSLSHSVGISDVGFDDLGEGLLPPLLESDGEIRTHLERF